jgi:hypothetical protein
MMKKYFVFLISLLILFYGISSFANESSSGLKNLNNTAFAYYSIGTASSTLFKFKLGTPSTVSVIGSAQPNFFGAGDWANPDGSWHYYVVETVSTPTIYRVDTTTGAVTNLGNITGILSGHSIAIMEWDHTTNKFYIISTNAGQSAEQAYFLNWTTKTVTNIGLMSTVCPGIAAGGFNRTGIFFALETIINPNTLYRINKTTGVPVMHGWAFFETNQNIDGAFDRSDWNYYVTVDNGSPSELLQYDSTLLFPPNHIGVFPFNNIISMCIITFPLTSVNQISSEIPSSYSLEQNYPNPFNSISNVKFQISNTGDVKLVVYDIMGREVQTIVNEQLAPGTYKTTFDGSNLPSGIYFYRLITDGFSETKRMTLIK